MTNILTSTTPSVQYLCKKDKRLAKVISAIGDISYEPYTDHYAHLINSIIGQMLSNKVADVIKTRFLELCKGKVTPRRVKALTIDDMRSIGLSRSKASYIHNLTAANIDFEELKGLPDEEVIKKLTAIRGIGNWTAKMFLIFDLDRQNVLPFEDGAFLQTYKWLYKTDDVSKMAIEKKCKKWAPYSSIAARYFYEALDRGMPKEVFKLGK
ncbi:DNA-3-methyladenine glycosylase 2 family protein [Phascolarctobacterium sp.]|uniref:DNA-3-methyladenine glycosylase family protein n=1 Tax=Phascolarctobacterium sp. TaxID=2049039 RepID=UPI00307867AE